jgi:hypothetical protein
MVLKLTMSRNKNEAEVFASAIPTDKDSIISSDSDRKKLLPHFVIASPFLCAG